MCNNTDHKVEYIYRIATHYARKILLDMHFAPFYQQIQGNTCKFSKKEGKC